MNYRRPFQQRLMIRIQLIIPIFALSCYSMLLSSESLFNKFLLEPIREIYEAFVIYTFFSLLTDMLGGERSIIIMTSGRKPVSHPGFLRFILSDVDISDSSTFLNIKRGILQYVWIKPFLCFGILFTELIGVYNINNLQIQSIYLWLMLLYNLSVTSSLYCLALFWKILWDDLKPFNPIGKFLCVKLIIFASYWQGLILTILNYYNIIPGSEDTDVNEHNSNIGLSIQNALLCVELIFFAIGHWISFSYKPFTLSKIPNARLKFKYAVRDMFGVKDLVQDFKITFHGGQYKDYKTFDSVNALVQHPSKSRMKKINQGLRYHYDGKHKHWITLNQGDNKSIVENATIGSDSLYSASISSTQGVISPKGPQSPILKDSSSLVSETIPNFPIAQTLNSDEFNYDNEMLEDDEGLYHLAYNVVNNYRLDQTEVKNLINYPVVENLIDSHLYGYKVRKLRESRRSLLERGKNYGSV